VGFNLAFKVLM